jgi:hypothetical protein
MIFNFGWVRRDVAVIMLLLSVFQPFSFVFATENPCQQAAIDRFNASQAVLDAAFDVAAKLPNDKYDSDVQSCNTLLGIAIALIMWQEGPKMTACQADPEPLTRTICIEWVLFEMGVLVHAAIAVHIVCLHDAYVEWYTSYTPIKTEHLQDSQANYDRLQIEYYACPTGEPGYSGGS